MRTRARTGEVGSCKVRGEGPEILAGKIYVARQPIRSGPIGAGQLYPGRAAVSPGVGVRVEITGLVY